MSGWIKLHRKIRKSEIFNNMELYRLVTICLTEASHAERDQPIGNQIVKLLPGQFVTGRFDLHDMYNHGLKLKEKVSEKTVWRWLEKLEKLDFLTIISTNKFSIVTVVNWGIYQGSDQEDDQQMTNKRPTDDQQMTTNKNVKNLKNVKNDKKERLKDICPESLTEIQDESNSLTPILETVKYGPDNTYYKMSIYFKSVVDEMAHQEGLEHLTKNANLQTWSNDFRKLVELDKQKDTQLIKSVMDWVVKDNFWKGNVLSAATFRKQFPKLVIAMNKGSKPKTGTSGRESIPIAQDSGAPSPSQEEYQEMIEYAKKIQASKEGRHA